MAIPLWLVIAFPIAKIFATSVPATSVSSLDPGIVN